MGHASSRLATTSRHLRNLCHNSVPAASLQRNNPCLELLDDRQSRTCPPFIDREAFCAVKAACFVFVAGNDSIAMDAIALPQGATATTQANKTSKSSASSSSLLRPRPYDRHPTVFDLKTSRNPSHSRAPQAPRKLSDQLLGCGLAAWPAHTRTRVLGLVAVGGQLWV